MNTRGSRTAVLFLTFFLSIMIFLPSVAKPTTIIWEENFDDGDLDNWIISGLNVNDFTPLPGNITNTNGSLRITGPNIQENIAEYPSTQVTGTWSFDLHVTPTIRNHFYVAFFGEKMGAFSGQDDFSPAYAYGVMPVTAPFGIVWDSEFVFYKRIKGSSSITQLRRFSPSQILGWHHFDITRSIEGEFNIFINGSHVRSFQDTTYTTTEVFRIAGGPGPGIDNIVVRDDFVLTTTPVSTTTPVPTTTNGTNVSFELLALSLLFLGLFKRKRNRIGT